MILLVTDVLIGSIQHRKMDRPTRFGSKQHGYFYYLSFYLSLLVLLLLVAGCGPIPSLDAQTDTSLKVSANTVQGLNLIPVEAEPLEHVLPHFHPDTRQFMEDARDIVPHSLPPLAVAAFTAVNPQLSSFTPDENQLSIVEITDDGYAEFPIAQANLSSNLFYQPNVLCLRNGQQVSCAPGADVWQLSLAPETAALMRARIPADKGDHIVKLAFRHKSFTQAVLFK